MLLIVARKIHCINWEKIWSSREYEGQWVRKNREFNLDLLVIGVGDCMLIRVGCGIRCWSLNMRRGSGRVRRGGCMSSVWWKYLYDIVEREGGGVANWFYEGVSFEVGNGENTSFWCDPWLDGGVMGSRVSRLFDLCVDSSVTITEMRRLG
jgi:hypothetical protein